MIEELNWRYATKKFDPTRKVAQELVDQIIEAGRLAPTSLGLQLFRIVEVSDKDLRLKIHEGPCKQNQIIDADRVFVLMHQEEYVEQELDEMVAEKATVQGSTVESLEGFRNSIHKNLAYKDSDEFKEWTARQTYIVLGFMLAAAANLKVDSCPMEGFDAAGLNDLLQVENYYPSVIMTVGYRHESDKYKDLKKFRRPRTLMYESK